MVKRGRRGGARARSRTARTRNRRARTRMDRRGEFKGMLKGIIIAAVVIFVLVSVLYFIEGRLDLKTQFLHDQESTITEATKNIDSFGTVFGGNFAWLDYIFGGIPVYLKNTVSGPDTQGISAAIIVIGIWLLLVLTFGDIMKMFSLLSPTVAWLVALILAILAANINLISVLSVFGIVWLAGLGVAAVFLNLFLVFLIFIGFNYGTTEFRKWVLQRKLDEYEMRAAVGRKKATEGLKTLKAVGKGTAKGERA